MNTKQKGWLRHRPIEITKDLDTLRETYKVVRDLWLQAHNGKIEWLCAYDVLAQELVDSLVYTQGGTTFGVCPHWLFKDSIDNILDDSTGKSFRNFLLNKESSKEFVSTATKASDAKFNIEETFDAERYSQEMRRPAKRIKIKRKSIINKNIALDTTKAIYFEEE